MLSRSWMKNQICSLACKVHKGELVEFCCIPMDARYKKSKQPLFLCKIKSAFHKGAGLDSVDASGLFERWFDKLELMEGKSIMPLIWDWGAVSSLLKNWAFVPFDMPRDLKSIYAYYQDRYDYRVEPLPSNHITFSRACRLLNITRVDRNVGSQAVAQIEMYEKLLKLR